MPSGLTYFSDSVAARSFAVSNVRFWPRCLPTYFETNLFLLGTSFRVNSNN